MPVKAIPKASIARNGIGAFVLPCYKVTLQYCNWGGSSKGARSLISSKQFNEVAEKNKKIFFNILKKSGHPKLIFNYSNCEPKHIDIANLSEKEIVNKLHEFSSQSGKELFKWNHKVLSNNESVRGIWSPMHSVKADRFRI